MRKGLGTISWIGLVVLATTMLTRCDSLLGPAYEPRHGLLDLVYLGGSFYILGTYLVARAAARGTLVRVLAVEVGLFTAAVAIWWIYHARYGTPPMVQSWDGYERVRPFHEQLALPGFAGLFAGVAILAVALRAPPRPTLGPLASRALR